MPPKRVLTAVALAMLTLGLPLARAAAQEPGGGAAIVENEETLVDPVATVPGVTPTPDSAATVVPFETSTPPPGETPTPTPTPTARTYISPGYGNAAQQSRKDKKREHDRACKASDRPPTSHMLGVPGVTAGKRSGTWVPLVIAVAAGAALFALVAFVLRKGGDEIARPGPLEGVATMVAICGGLAGLAAQFVPGVAVKERPPASAPRATQQPGPE
ncbi:MAG: hypothetical protein ACRDQ2_08220 [Gaiellales bacterium]